MGIACPLGVGVEHVWKRMLAGHSGIGAIKSFDASGLPARIAGEIPLGAKADGGLDINEWMRSAPVSADSDQPSLGHVRGYVG